MSWTAEESEMEYSETMEEYGEETATFQGYYKNYFTYETENLTVLAEKGYRVRFEPKMEVNNIPNIYEIKRGEETVWRAVIV